MGHLCYFINRSTLGGGDPETAMTTKSLSSTDKLLSDSARIDVDIHDDWAYSSDGTNLRQVVCRTEKPVSEVDSFRNKSFKRAKSLGEADIGQLDNYSRDQKAFLLSSLRKSLEILIISVWRKRDNLKTLMVILKMNHRFVQLSSRKLQNIKQTLS